MTFVVQASTNLPVEAEFNGRRLGEATLSAGPQEFNFTFAESGLLAFRQGSNAVAFHLVRPGDAARLREEAGYLYTDRAAAILLARHLFPPKHDRTWEALRLLKGLFVDTRPVARTGILLGEAALLETADADPGPAGDPARRGSFWQRAAVTNGPGELHGLIAAGTNGVSRVDVGLLVLSGRDLEQGMNPVEFRVKLEWYLQRLAPLGLAHWVVAMPALNARQEERLSVTLQSVRTAVLGNGAAFLGSPARWPGDSAARGWLPVVERQISARLNLCR